ncbi:hypothetical protein BT96DRAFT_1000611 [Gymnopus androsaceus JB14]|uniref:Uncharacterized protein n=1 Tax=Gymnopus androsaceus JB14 TaxID=1447944 RepID=A0A6A4H4J5_9AGAR|nr:hypothetical protein BT96DRAFT_1000611 [Gymnopus androsaceus JB14]
MGKQSAKQVAVRAAATAAAKMKREDAQRLEFLEQEFVRLSRLEAKRTEESEEEIEQEESEEEISEESGTEKGNNFYEKEYRKERKKAKRAKTSLDKARDKLETERAEWKDAKKSLKKQNQELEKELAKTRKRLETTEFKISDLCSNKENLRTDVSRLGKKVARVEEQKEKAVLKASEKARQEVNTFAVKEDGIVSSTARDLSRDLVAIGLKPGMVGPALDRVLAAAGVEVKGNLSRTTVRCTVIEGGVAADLQLVDAMKESDGFTISGDGSTHRSINYESHFITVNKDGTHKSYFAGLTRAPTHTSQEQCDAWERLFRHLTAVYNASPLAKQNGLIDVRELIQLLTGMLSDHAEDQKKLAALLEALKQAWDRELRGEDAMLDLGTVALFPFIAEATATVVKDAGGHEIWNSLSEDEQAYRKEEVYRALYRRLGQEAFEKLTPTQQRTIDLFIWSGCEIHKDLNTVKWGAIAMGKWWVENNVQGPKKLLNKANKDAAAIGGRAGENAVEVSFGGAIKATSIAGALFNHKDDKKGQHDTYRIVFEEKLGHLGTFPDTLNNRFQTHALAAEQLILHLDLYILFLLQVKDRKEKRNWNNLEQNLWDALHDIPTLTELAALAVYSQTISVPYIAYIRQDRNRNALDMGPHHQKVLAACKAVVDNPELVLGPDAFHSPATVDGAQFHRPEIMYAVHRLAPSLPHLRSLVQAIFTGAFEAWPRFMTEFGKSSDLSAEERERSFRHTTNDLNESAFGILRRNWRFAGNTSLLWHNSRVQYKMNGTREYIAEMDDETRAFLWKEARRMMEAGKEKEDRKRQALHDLAVVAKKQKRDTERKEKQDAKYQELLSLHPIYLTPASFPAKFTIPKIILQLAWHRTFSPARTQVPIKSKCGSNRAALLETLTRAMELFRNEGKSADECIRDVQDALSNEEDSREADNEEEDMEE